MPGRDEYVIAAQELRAGAQSLFVHRQGQQVAGVAGEDIAGVRVAGVFHAHDGVLVH
ncbi:hypothetical protein D3C72_2577010 [compost metagenome]